jgi:hypothetical protein
MATATTTFGTNRDWASLFLKDLGVPVTDNNINNVLRWMAAEKPAKVWSANNNPLNSTSNAQTYTFNNTKQYAYATPQDAANQTANLIASNKTGMYASIYNALANNAPLSTFSAAVVSSPWDANRYGGNPNYFTQVPIPGVFPYIAPVAGVQGITSGVKNSVAPTPSGCASKKPIILFNTPGSSVTGLKYQLTGCEIKAFIGGASIIFGGITIALGISIIARGGNSTKDSIKDLAAALKATQAPAAPAPLTDEEKYNKTREAEQRYYKQRLIRNSALREARGTDFVRYSKGGKQTESQLTAKKAANKPKITVSGSRVKKGKK